MFGSARAYLTQYRLFAIVSCRLYRVAGVGKLHDCFQSNSLDLAGVGGPAPFFFLVVADRPSPWQVLRGGPRTKRLSAERWRGAAL